MGTRGLAAAARGRSRRCWLPALPGDDHPAVAETLGVAGGQKDLAMQVSRDVRCTLPARTSRRLKTDTYCENCGTAHSGGSLQLCDVKWKRWKDTHLSKTSRASSNARGSRLEKQNMGIHLDERHGKGHQICSILWADNDSVMSHTREHLQQMLKDFVEETEKRDLDWNPNYAFAKEAKKDMPRGQLFHGNLPWEIAQSMCMGSVRI